MSNELFRTCPESGLQFHKPAEQLMRINAVLAVVILLVGGITALLVTLTRWPAVHLLPADRFYQILTLHGVNMLIFWMITFEMAVLYFCSSTLLRCRLATPKIAWLGFLLMLAGIIINNLAVLNGDASVMMTSYVPMPANPNFYLGLILFAVGALLGCFVFLGTLVIAKEEKTYEGSIPLVTFGALTACIIAVFTIASGAIILIPTYLWSLGYINNIDAAMYRLVWWALGHSSQQINVAAHVSVWYAIAAIVFGARPLSEKVSRTAFFLYIAFLQIASAHHLLVDPGLSSEWKIFNTSYAMYLAVLASMVHGLTVPGSIEVAQRAKGFTNGLFQWLRTDWLRLHRRHLGCRHGYRANQHHHSQHHLRAWAFPRDGRDWIDACLHVIDVLPDSGLVPSSGHDAGAGEMATIPVRFGDDGLYAGADGRRDAGRRAQALGYGVYRRNNRASPGWLRFSVVRFTSW
jgi:cytochrome c oxidase subunit 1